MIQRQSEMMIRLTMLELDALEEKVKKASMPREFFCRRVLDGKAIKEAPPMSFHLMWREIRRVGYALDQLLRLAKTQAPSYSEEISSIFDMAYRSSKLFLAAYTTQDH